jgi:hypothetical protein
MENLRANRVSGKKLVFELLVIRTTRLYIQNRLQQADRELSESVSYREPRSSGLAILVEKKRYRDKSQPNEGQHAVAPSKVQFAV